MITEKENVYYIDHTGALSMKDAGNGPTNKDNILISLFNKYAKGNCQKQEITDKAEIEAILNALNESNEFESIDEALKHTRVKWNRLCLCVYINNAGKKGRDQ